MKTLLQQGAQLALIHRAGHISQRLCPVDKYDYASRLVYTLVLVATAIRFSRTTPSYCLIYAVFCTLLFLYCDRCFNSLCGQLLVSLWRSY